MTLVTVLADKFARSFPRHAEGATARVVELGDALEREYSTDAHFAAYATPNGRRLCREALDAGVAVELNAIVFDVDCPDVHGTSEPAPPAWRADVRGRVCVLGEAHPEPFFYETRGGARIVYRQHEPTIIRCHDDARRWSQDYAIAVAYLCRRFGIVADHACGDWQRLYRLPRATREPGGAPENWPTSGDPHRVGTLRIDACRADVEHARELVPSTFAERRIIDFAPNPTAGEGLLYHLLRGRGDVLREHASGAYVVRCPREREHSTGRTGDGSTLLYRPAAGECVGLVHCKHTHCTGLSAADWLAEFSSAELDRAREASGIEAAETSRREVWNELVARWTSENEVRLGRGRSPLRPGVVWHWFRERCGDRPPPRGCRLPLPMRNVA